MAAASGVAILSAVATALTATASAGGAVYQGISGQQQQKKASQATAQQKMQQDKLLKDAENKSYLAEQERIRDQQRSKQKAGGSAFDGRQSTILTGSSPNASGAFGGRTLIGG